MHCVIETQSYQRAAKQAGLSEEDCHEIVTVISENPEAGDLIKGTGGARKLRFGRDGKGKSGGVRVITYYCDDDVPVFLLDVFSKGQRVNLSKGERNELKKILAELASDYRKMVRERVTELREKAS